MLEFRVSYDEEVLEGPLDGRLLLMISDDDGEEPRFQISNYPDTQLIFGVDIEDLNPGEDVIVDGGVKGFPLRNVDEVPAGEYWVQALVHVYEIFHRSDGHTVKMPMDRGEGQKWNKAPGNLYSTPVKVQIGLENKVTINIKLDQVIPPFEDPEDTRYIKYVRIESKLLTEFWGRTIHLGAVVLLPHGFDDHPEARYPLLVWHGHFKRELYAGFREEPPEADLEPEPLKQAPRKHVKDSTGPDIPREREYYDAPNVIAQREAHRLYNDWTSPGFPRMIVVCIQHANPYYDDSYAVNSANIGPYGDAINHELIPHIEERFRGIGEGWARTTMGGSTGGWEALATQVFYPEMYNGCWAWCPDSIDFRDLSLVNIYDDGNAYYVEGRWRRAARPGMRTTVGEILYTVEDENHLELVKGTKGRSGGQWDVWFATYGPVGEDGYVKPPWDKETGIIDPSVAEYWRENYDLRHILERDWATLGPKLEGKISIFCGDMDAFYLNNAVYLMEEFLVKTENPYYNGQVSYGDRYSHCWYGDSSKPSAYDRYQLVQRHVREMAEHITRTAPPGVDTESWRY